MVIGTAEKEERGLGRGLGRGEEALQGEEYSVSFLEEDGTTAARCPGKDSAGVDGGASVYGLCR